MDYRAFVLNITPVLERRLDDYRLAHSTSVARTAVELARMYGANTEQAFVAGLLHDWDKCVSEEELMDHARRFRIEIPPDRDAALTLLHAPCGAAVLRREYPELDKEITSAIKKHTVGAVEMSNLDKIIYIADMIEPLRTKKDLEPLRDMVGTSQLDDLFFQCYKQSLAVLLNTRRYIDPVAVQVWNKLVADQPRESADAPKQRRTLKLGQD